MNKLRPYQVLGKMRSLDDVLEYFLSTLLPTNRRWSFYVDWEKVVKFLEEYKVELGILNAVIGSSDNELRRVLKKYPEVIKVFPRLLAIREDAFVILVDPEKSLYNEFDFRQFPDDDEEIEKYITFWRDSGLSNALKRVKSLQDYYLGVEVGTDTNGRKNRGGTEWEGFVQPLVEKAAEKIGAEVYVRKKFERVLEKKGIKEVPRDLKRNMDFLLSKGDRFVDIEANFFSGPGTKLEVPGAYSNRNVSSTFSLSLFLFTDGRGWLTAKERIRDYFEMMPCVVNYEMARKGVLEAAFQQYLG